MPGGQQARAVFEAVEQARVEAIGSRRMSGVAEQSHRDARRPLPSRQVRRDHRPRRRADRGGRRHDGARAADRPGAAAGRARSSSSCGGRSSRTAPAAVSTGWRRVLEDQRKFGDAVHDLLDSLDMGEDRSRDPRRRKTARRAIRIAARTRPARRARPPTPRTWRSMSMEEAEASADDCRDRRARRWMRRPPTWPTMPRWASRRPPPSRGGRATGRTSRAGPTTGPSPCASTRPSPPRNCASRRSSTACAAISTSSFRICRAWSRGSPTACSAA